VLDSPWSSVAGRYALPAPRRAPWLGSGKSAIVLPFVVPEFLPKTLEDAMREGLSMVEKLSFTLQLFSALIYLESCDPQIVHRDIKPQNIFIRGKSCVLGDFGLMKILHSSDAYDAQYLIDSTGPRLPRFYRTTDLVDYCRGKTDLTTKSDVFQLGLVLAELYSGVNPLQPAKDIYSPVVLNSIEPIRGSQAPAIRATIEEMLRFNAADRPRASELFDKWEGLFLEVVGMAHNLEGRMF